MCNIACQAPHGTNTCSLGVCMPSCGTAFGNCDGSASTGCEAVFANDANNCGACGTVCQANNATNTCASGVCSPVCSQTYFKSCDGNPNNGCETDTRSSKQMRRLQRHVHRQPDQQQRVRERQLRAHVLDQLRRL